MSINIELEEYIKLIDRGLKEVLSNKSLYSKKIYDAMEYSLFTGGKRLRPIMAIKSYELFSKDINKILPFAMGIEMIHTYSLIHDDLPSMDNDDFRRGKPTNHKVFGEAMAILAGDGLLNLAFETMLDFTAKNINSAEEKTRCIKAMKEISIHSGCNGMIGGQVLDLMSSYDNMNEDKLVHMYKTKTAGLFQASLVAGAILGGANDKEIDSMKNFGLYLGLAYQIRDDLLDESQDLNINKFTYLRYHSSEDCEKQVNILSHKAIESLESLHNYDTTFLKELACYLIERVV